MNLVSLGEEELFAEMVEYLRICWWYRTCMTCFFQLLHKDNEKANRETCSRYSI